jgi:hypothetical protein
VSGVCLVGAVTAEASRAAVGEETNLKILDEYFLRADVQHDKLTQGN